MARRKKITTPQKPTVVDNGWTTVESFGLGNKTLTPGVLVTIRGERGGKFKFLSHVRRPDGVEWLNVVGGPKGVTMFRAFRPDRIGRILKSRFA